MRHFAVRNFEKFQHYRDRKPPWIKLYRDLWGDARFFRLKPDSKLLFIGLLTVASLTDNHIPDDVPWIAAELRLDERAINLESLVDAGLLLVEQDASAEGTSLEHVASESLASCQHDAPCSVSVSSSDSVSGSEGGDARGGRQKRAATEWPVDLQLTESMRAFATERNINADAEFELWRNDCAAHGRSYVSWEGAWRTRILNAPKFGGGTPLLPVVNGQGASAGSRFSSGMTEIMQAIANEKVKNGEGTNSQANGSNQGRVAGTDDRCSDSGSLARDVEAAPVFELPRGDYRNRS